MFPGFKSPPIGLKQTSAGNSLVLPFGTEVGRMQQNIVAEMGLNNLVIGSGINFVSTNSVAGGANNMIVIGNTDGITGGNFPASLTLTGNNNRSIYMIASTSAIADNTWSASLSDVICLATKLVTSTAPGGSSVTIGSGSTVATGTNAVAIGPNVTSNNTGNVAVGGSASSSGAQTTAVGYSSTASGAQGVSIGNNCTAYGAQSVAVGYNCEGPGASTIAIGNSAGSASTTNMATYCIHVGSTGWPNSATNYGTNVIGGNPTGTNILGGGPGVSWGQMLGWFNTIDFPGQTVISNGGFAGNGDCQVSTFAMRTYTTNATAQEVGVTTTTSSSLATTPTSYITLWNNASYAFTIDIVAQTQGGHVDTAMWTTQFLIQRGASAAATALVGTPSGLTAPLFATTGAVSGAWAVAVTADTTNGRPAIKVTGAASTNISWVANVRMTKVGY